MTDGRATTEPGAEPGDPPAPDPLAILQLYGRHRIEDQADYYSHRAQVYERARRHAVIASAILLVFAASFGALGAADSERRAAWAFAAAALSSLATAIATYEAAFGFERFSRQYTETLGALRVAQSRVPGDPGGTSSASPSVDEVRAFVGRMEGILRNDVDTWSHLSADQDDEGSA